MPDYVYGLNKSGISITKLLKKQKKIFDCWDDNKKTRKKINKIFPKYNLSKINKLNSNKYNSIYITPGIPILDKRFLNIKKSKIKRDLNLYYQNIKNEKIIAITGTNGKSTTTKLIGEIIKKKYKKTFVGGNIGYPLCNSFTDKIKYSHHVIELSSFQLETIKNFESNVSILLNISRDHLDRYKNLKSYIFAKKNILNKKNINLISLDDEYSRRIFYNKNINNKISFSVNNTKADIFYKEGYINDNFFSKNKKIKFPYLSLDLMSTYNIQNILAAYIVCKHFKISIKFFEECLRNFKGLPYRSSIIFNSKSRLIINNSKATNISAALSTLENKKNIYLILGGIAKEDGFEKFSKFNKELKNIYIYGRSRYLINRQLKLFETSKIFKTLEDVVNNLWHDLSFIDYKATIVYAPACASYDQFENFEKRGEYFNQLIFNKIKK